jgi:hypothetical protein
MVSAQFLRAHRLAPCGETNLPEEAEPARLYCLANALFIVETSKFRKAQMCLHP